MLQKNTLDFLEELSLNNSKDWFDENRSRYERAKADVLQLAEKLLSGLSELEPDLLPLKARDCMFRINRDVRFSANKSPYKTNMGFWMNRGGKKSQSAGYYVHIEPGGKSFIAAGMYGPDSSVLKLVRTEILYGFEEFKSIIHDPKFLSFFPKIEFGDHKTVRVPQGFDATHPSAEFLKLKSFVGTFSFSDEALCDESVVQTILSAFSVAVPFVRFLNLAFADADEQT